MQGRSSGRRSRRHGRCSPLTSSRPAAPQDHHHFAAAGGATVCGLARRLAPDPPTPARPARIVFKTHRPAEPNASATGAAGLLRDLEMAAAIIHRAQRRLAGVGAVEMDSPQRQAARGQIEHLRHQLNRLGERIPEEEEPDEQYAQRVQEEDHALLVKDLGANDVRYTGTGYLFPHMGIAELQPPTATTTSWDFSYIDPVVEDALNALAGHPSKTNGTKHITRTSEENKAGLALNVKTHVNVFKTVYADNLGGSIC